MAIKRNKLCIAIDFDGVIHRYSKGFIKGKPYNEPVLHTKQALQQLEKDFEIVIFTARDNLKDVKSWLKKYGFKSYKITNKKPKAILYIDDNAIRFVNWKKVLKQVYKLCIKQLEKK